MPNVEQFAIDRFDDDEYEGNYFGVSDISSLACDGSRSAESERLNSTLESSSVSLDDYGGEASSHDPQAEATRDGSPDPSAPPQAEAYLRTKEAWADAEDDNV